MLVWISNFFLSLSSILGLYMIILLYMSLFFEINQTNEMIALFMTNIIITNPHVQFLIMLNIQTFIYIGMIKICMNIINK